MTVEELVWVLKAKAGDFTKGFKEAETSADRSSKGVLNSMNAMKVGIAAIVTFISAHIVSGMGRAALAMSEFAGQGEGLRRAFTNLAASAGESSDRLLAALRRGTAGTVSDFKLMQEANRALISGLPASAEKMEELARVARGLGQAVGINATEAFQRMVRGISKQEIELLDELFGGSVKFIDILRKLGPAASATEKQMAIYNAVLAEGQKRVEAMGGSTVTFADRMAQAEARIENFKESLGRKLIPVIEKLIPIALSAADALAKLFNVKEISTDPMVERIREIQTEMAKLGKEIDKAREGGSPGFVIHAMEQQWEALSHQQAVIAAQWNAQQKALADAKAKQEAEAAAEADRAAFYAGLGGRAPGMARRDIGQTQPRGPGSREDIFDPATGKFRKPTQQEAVERGYKSDIDESLAEQIKELTPIEKGSHDFLKNILRTSGESHEIMQELTALLDARTNKMIDNAFRLERSLSRIPGIGTALGKIPGLADAGKTLGKVAATAANAFVGISAGISIFKSLNSLFGGRSGPVYGDISEDSMSDAKLKSEIERFKRMGQEGVGWVNTFTAELEFRKQRRSQEGGRTFSAVATLSEATGHQIVANTASIVVNTGNTVTELQGIRDMLSQGINVRASSLSTSMATDAETRSRAAGL